MSALAIDDHFVRNLKRLKILNGISGGAAVVGLALMLLGTDALFDITRWAENMNSPRWVAVGIGAIFGFPAHFVMLGTIVLALRSLERVRFIGTISLVMCGVSLIFLPADYACLSDMAKEYPIGVDIQGELQWLRVGVVMHYIYLICQLTMCFQVSSILKTNEQQRSTQPSESLFYAMHILGVVCAGIGWALTLIFYLDDLPEVRRKWYILPMIVIILIPYAIVFGGWLWAAREERQAGFLDEKQKFDLVRAGTTAWGISLGVMAILFLMHLNTFEGPGSVLWLPSLTFTSLLAFSMSSLYYFRRS